MVNTLYRDDTEGPGQRLAGLIEEHRERRLELADLAPLVSHRWGRIAFGAAGLLGVLGLILVACFCSSFAEGWGAGRPIGPLTTALLAVWSLALVWGLLAAGVAFLGFRHRCVAPFIPSGDVHRDIARLEGGLDLYDRSVRGLHRLETASVALPLMALGLLLPVTLHLGVARLFELHGFFDAWIACVAVGLGLSHLVVAVQLLRLARRMRRQPPASLAESGVATLGWAVATAAVPGLLITVTFSLSGGIVLLVLAPLVMAVTGVLFVPGLCSWACLQIARERETLGIAPSDQRQLSPTVSQVRPGHRSPDTDA